MSNKEKADEVMYTGSIGLICIMLGFFIGVLSTMIGGWETIHEQPFRLFMFCFGIAAMIIGAILTVVCEIIYNKYFFGKEDE